MITESYRSTEVRNCAEPDLSEPENTLSRLSHFRGTGSIPHNTGHHNVDSDPNLKGKQKTKQKFQGDFQIIFSHILLKNLEIRDVS